MVVYRPVFCLNRAGGITGNSVWTIWFTTIAAIPSVLRCILHLGRFGQSGFGDVQLGAESKLRTKPLAQLELARTHMCTYISYILIYWIPWHFCFTGRQRNISAFLYIYIYINANVQTVLHAHATACICSAFGRFFYCIRDVRDIYIYIYIYTHISTL